MGLIWLEVVDLIRSLGEDEEDRGEISDLV